MVYVTKFWKITIKCSEKQLENLIFGSLFQYSKSALNYKEKHRNIKCVSVMSAECGKLENSNCFRRAHKDDFPKFGHIVTVRSAERLYLVYIPGGSCECPYFCKTKLPCKHMFANPYIHR